MEFLPVYVIAELQSCQYTFTVVENAAHNFYRCDSTLNDIMLTLISLPQPTVGHTLL